VKRKGILPATYVLRFTDYVLRFTFYGLRFTHYVLRFTDYALRITFYALHPSPIVNETYVLRFLRVYQK
jgi:hypothetical protein